MRVGGCLGLAAVLVLAACGPDSNTKVADLYQAKTFVTGADERFRHVAFAAGIGDVLAKVSGDAGLIGDARVAALGAKADALVASYTYHDRMEGLPVGDEQGTRDRPFDLIIHYRPDQIDASLKALGRAPWTALRPRLTVFLGVSNHGVDYLLASDGTRGVDQRDALAGAAWQAGMPMQLPNAAVIAAVPLTTGRLLSGDAIDLNAAARAAGGDLALIGTIVWHDGYLGWRTDWRLKVNGKEHHWMIRDVNYDDAFRNGLRGAAQILSGHGEPN